MSADRGAGRLFEVDPDGAIHADPETLAAVGKWVLARYNESVERRSGAGSEVLMGLITAMAESRRIREVVGPMPIPAVAPAVPVRVEVSVIDAAALMGCKARWVRHLASVGRVPSRRVGRRVLLIDVTDYMED